MPLAQIRLVGAHRDLRVDRRGAADAAARDQCHRSGSPIADRHCEPDRPPQVVHRVGFPASEVGGCAVRPELEQQHRAPALGELAGDHAATGARPHDHDLELIAHPPIPR
jgi:hypothetical protein